MEDSRKNRKLEMFSPDWKMCGVCRGEVRVGSSTECRNLLSTLWYPLCPCQDSQLQPWGDIDEWEAPIGGQVEETEDPMLPSTSALRVLTTGRG